MDEYGASAPTQTPQKRIPAAYQPYVSWAERAKQNEQNRNGN
jgi:hypothetical protein